MRTLTIIITSILLISCATFKKSLSLNEFIILSATVQKWHGGQKSSGTGIHYKIIALANSNNVTIDSLHLAGYSAKIGIMKGNKAAETIKKGDTLTLKVGTPNSIALQLNGTVSYNGNLIKKVTFEKLQDLYYP